MARAILVATCIFTSHLALAETGGPPRADDDAVHRFLWPLAGQQIVDRSGHEITAEELHDKVVVLTFFDTRCSILCVGRLLDLNTVVKGLASAERGRVAVLALSVDPAVDGPAALGSFADGLKLDATALRPAAGGVEATRATMDAIGWHPPADAPDRAPGTVFVFDRQGAFAMRYAGDPVDRRRLGQDLTTLAGLDRGVGQAVAHDSTPH